MRELIASDERLLVLVEKTARRAALVPRRLRADPGDAVRLPLARGPAAAAQLPAQPRLGEQPAVPAEPLDRAGQPLTRAGREGERARSASSGARGAAPRSAGSCRTSSPSTSTTRAACSGASTRSTASRRADFARDRPPSAPSPIPKTVVITTSRISGSGRCALRSSPVRACAARMNVPKRMPPVKPRIAPSLRPDVLLAGHVAAADTEDREHQIDDLGDAEEDPRDDPEHRRHDEREDQLQVRRV